jgi:hypothetical protein
MFAVSSWSVLRRNRVQSHSGSVSSLLFAVGCDVHYRRSEAHVRLPVCFNRYGPLGVAARERVKQMRSC